MTNLKNSSGDEKSEDQILDEVFQHHDENENLWQQLENFEHDPACLELFELYSQIERFVDVTLDDINDMSQGEIASREEVLSQMEAKKKKLISNLPPSKPLDIFLRLLEIE